MSIFSIFGKQRTAPAARERLQILLAHERVSAGSDLVSLLREEILAVIAKHVQVDSERVRVTMDRDEHMSILEIDVEIPLGATVRAA
ncbi:MULTISPECIES: cell division topological specificity factor MinE [Rhizobium]|jgi:cell division topological specificity factor|uniref:Cell division topological specificity factor n=1 Tax=Rhizobium altiplani TaxID=1864509 RepID=A0A120FPB5_9HYPH|nr:MULTISPECIES: cell division topological specificity factor MinE [Rhizobium]KWV56691.1 cell division topological specificity factor [Rhizobium altiplani]MBD9446457.1 cell division topological specificity factor MinE [Rhizobium sp. RHZ01]MBD9451377.1 cell division topological specificity factor MinE [Rhizobium sp. RHZ02]NMN72761.1 cell division topological specificity factor [Rhizobium sp. 57MFTsu3.2]